MIDEGGLSPWAHAGGVDHGNLGGIGLARCEAVNIELHEAVGGFALVHIVHINNVSLSDITIRRKDVCPSSITGVGNNDGLNRLEELGEVDGEIEGIAPSAHFNRIEVFGDATIEVGAHFVVTLTEVFNDDLSSLVEGNVVAVSGLIFAGVHEAHGSAFN